MYDSESNVTSCSRWDYDRVITPESVVSQFDLVCGNDYLRSLGSSVYMGSKMLGSILFGLLSDKFGRKKMIVVSSLMVAVFGVATSFSPNMITWIILRGMVALSGTGLFLCGFVYCMEIVGGIWSTIISFGLEYSWATGYLTIPLIAWALPRWSDLQLGISVPTAVFTCIMIIPGLVPESPRWLLVSGRKEEAEEVIQKIEKINGRDNSKNNAEMMNTKEEEVEKGTLLDLLKSGPLLRCTLIMYYLWFTNNLVYYGFTLNSGSLFPGNLHINMLISAALEYLAYTVSIFSFLYLGRRWSTSVFMSACGLALIITPFLPTDSSKAALAQVGKFFITASFAMVYQYATEMFPTVVRNAGIGSCSTFSRIGSIIAPYVGRELVKIKTIKLILSTSNISGSCQSHCSDALIWVHLTLGWNIDSLPARDKECQAARHHQRGRGVLQVIKAEMLAKMLLKYSLKI